MFVIFFGRVWCVCLIVFVLLLLGYTGDSPRKKCEKNSIFSPEFCDGTLPVGARSGLMPGVHFQLKYMHQPQDLYGESEVMFGYVHNKTTTPPCMAYKECRNEYRPCADKSGIVYTFPVTLE